MYHDGRYSMGPLRVVQAHQHGFVREGTEWRTAYVTHNREGATEITAGLKDLQASAAMGSRVLVLLVHEAKPLTTHADSSQVPSNGGLCSSPHL